MKQILYPFLLFAIILSCESPVTESLDRAESLLDVRPDSALLFLQNWDQRSLRHPKNTARYALLMSKALDKNHIDVNSDTLIIKAVNYYSRHGNTRYKMLSSYYHGIVLKNAKEYSAAIIAFENAEKNALALYDTHHLGLIYRNKSNVFTSANNHLEAIACMKKAIEYFGHADEEVYKDYAKYSLAVDYLNNKDYKKADSLLNSLVQHSNDANLLHSCHLRQANILAHLGQDPKKAVQLFQDVPQKYYQILDYAFYALSLEKTGDREASDYWIKKGYAHCKSHADSATIDSIKSKIELGRGHHWEAFNLINHAANVQDSLTRLILQQSVSMAQRDYYKNDAILQKERMVATRRFWVLICTLCVFVLALVLIGILWRSREKDRLLKDQMARLAIGKQTLDNAYKENAFLLGSLFSSRIDHLDTLTEQYYTVEEDEKKEALFKEIKDCVSSLRNNPELFNSLEKDLDRYCDGIMKKFREQVPRIKGENLNIITLFFAGISDDVIHLLLNRVSAQSLRMTRSRFRKEILAAQAPDSELFLNMLMKKKRQQDNNNES